jgi:F-type H+-transporting ATPase subunit epsilon
MAEKIRLEIITPHGPVYTGEVDHVRAPGSDGDFGVLPGHTPMLSPLQVGIIQSEGGDEGEQIFATSGGIAEVHPDRVIVMAETAEKREEIDVDRAREAARRAQQRLQGEGEEPEAKTDYDRARAALMRSLNRLRVAGEGFEM